MQILLLWVDRETYLPRQVNWVERGGDSWMLELGALDHQPAAAGLGHRVQAAPGHPREGRVQFFRHQKEVECALARPRES